MSPEKQRIAIAEACGWQYVNTNKHTWIDPQGNSEPLHQGAPDYPNDLNAMREAEKAVFAESTRWLRFVCQLLHVCVGVGDMQVGDQMVVLLRATAAQHAEALLRTIGKWEE